MRLGRASAYGMLAMINIARNGAGNSNGGANSAEHACSRARQISQATGIPIEYLRKVLQRLTRARLVASERGRSGGFRLARRPANISLLEIVEAIEGPVDEAGFIGEGLAPGHQRIRLNPALREWRRHATLGIRSLLESESLADLMD